MSENNTIITEENLQSLISSGKYKEAHKLGHLMAYWDYVNDSGKTHEIGYYISKREQDVTNAIQDHKDRNKI